MRTYVLDRTAKVSLYEQLYRGLRADIESGMLSAGMRLPSKRALAHHLGVSVVTVEGAYDQLVAEGYVVARPRSGFFVQEMAAPVARNVVFGATSAAERAAVNGFGAEKGAKRAECFADFTGTRAPEGLFPYQAWARTLRRVLADESERTVLAAGTPQGSPRLRCAIAEHLRGFRGMNVHPDQIVVGSGAQSLYGLLVQLLGRQRTYGIEDPGYPRLARIYRSNDVSVVPVPLDESGPHMASLKRAGIDVFHCTPSHQFPLGLTTPITRRHALIEWAGADRYLIEDDFDCEFRMAGRPVPPMQTLDQAGCVIYANTFTKTLGAAFRIGYVVLPWTLVRRFRERLGFYACTVGALEQLTLARFMESGDYERHVNRQRTYFRRVQNTLIGALASSAASSSVQVRHGGAGLHFLLEVSGVKGEMRKGAGSPSAADFERGVAARALSEGVRLAPLADYFVGPATAEGSCGEDPTRSPAFVMSFSSLAMEDVQRAAEVIARAILAERG